MTTTPTQPQYVKFPHAIILKSSNKELCITFKIEPTGEFHMEVAAASINAQIQHIDLHIDTIVAFLDDLPYQMTNDSSLLFEESRTISGFQISAMDVAKTDVILRFTLPVSHGSLCLSDVFNANDINHFIDSIDDLNLNEPDGLKVAQPTFDPSCQSRRKKLLSRTNSVRRRAERK